MTAEQAFSIANLAATAGWIVLIAAPPRHWLSAVVAGRAFPLLFSIAYVVVLGVHWSEGTGGFGTLTGVAALFSNPWLLLGGWIHYLAFDLFTGAWEVRDAAERGISRWLVVPCLGLTFMFGPAGLLAYFGLRSVTARANIAA